MDTIVKRAKALALVAGALALATLVVLVWPSGGGKPGVEALGFATATLTATPAFTVTPTPPSNRPPPVPTIDKTVNDQGGPITVTVGD